MLFYEIPNKSQIAKGCCDDFKQVREILQQNHNNCSFQEFRQYTLESEKIISQNIKIVEKMFDKLINKKK